MPLIEYEREVFAECGAWKNFIELEDSLSLDELIELYEATVERQNRMMRMIAAAMGAEIDEPQTTKRNVSNSELPPAWAVDPKKGGQVKSLESAEDVYSLPIKIGYEIINKSET